MKGRARAVFDWIWLGGAVGLACGVASAAFLLLLEQATRFRVRHEMIVYALPFSGIALGLIYERWGQPIQGGNNLVIDTIHDEGPQIPLRMAPMVLLGAVVSHLFGASAGREGTSVQMGASLADAIAHAIGVRPETRRQLLAAGMAGGFGAVFGTPVAGALFGLEVVWVGQIEYGALVPALASSLVGDFVTRHLGVVHTHYPTLGFVELTATVVGKLGVIGLAMGLSSVAFVELTHRLKHVLEARVARLPIRMFLGGVAVVLLWKAMATSDYLGLGVPTIVRAFSEPDVAPYAFAAKLLFTSITLASGFLGGEVTPLFFVGATLGSVLARLLGLPIALGAGVGMAAIFGAAANTPLALSVMAVELLGASVLPHVVVVVVIAYLVSGHRGIYPAQRILRRKHGGRPLERAATLREFRESIAPSSAP